MNYLIVAAHPDDEALGAGATIRRLTTEGHRVDLCILSSEARARAFRSEDRDLRIDLHTAAELLGIQKIYEASFPNIEMNTVPHLQLVQFIERSLQDSGAEIVITHHPSDTNNDHMHTSLACQAAIRLFQRRPDASPLNALLFMEVLSSTDWSVNTSMNPFHPNLYMEVGEENLRIKLKALDAYRGVMRPYPHPRSDEAVTGLALYRGGQAGIRYAEAFECVLQRIPLHKPDCRTDRVQEQ